MKKAKNKSNQIKKAKRKIYSFFLFFFRVLFYILYFHFIYIQVKCTKQNKKIFPFLLKKRR